MPRLILISIAPMVLLGAQLRAETPVDFALEIQPILSEKCIICHGQNHRSREADLRLDLRDRAIVRSETEISIIPGSADQSEAVLRIESDDPDMVMPPPDHGEPLTQEQRKLFRRWINEGAPYDVHWAFVSPDRPQVPANQNPIDYLVRQRLAKEGLSPSPLADRSALLRRLSLDLTGLPPTIEEMDAFLSDNSADAYQKQVERLLASPHYGERWARWWLDAARYADSDGYEKDLPRSQWPWRDWVINAFNRDLPYDQFITEQVAGDLLPDATQEQQVATGFLRNGMINEEGAINAEEFRMEGLIDRMDCLGKAILGLTVSCTQCHEHKYDPMSHQEYFRLMAYINNDYEAISRVYSPKHLETIRDINNTIASQNEKIKKAVPEWQQQLKKWIDDQKANTDNSHWETMTPTSAEVPDGICHPEILADKTVLNLGFRPTSTRLTVIAETPQTALTGLRLSALVHGDLIFGGPGRSHLGSFAISEMKVEAAPLDAPEEYKKVDVKAASADVASRQKLIDSFFRLNKEDKRTVGGAHYLIDGKTETAWSPDRGAKLHNEPCEAVLEFAEPICNEKGSRLRIAMEFRHGGLGGHGRANNFIGRFRIDGTGEKAPKANALPAEVRRAIGKPEAERTAEDNNHLLWAWARTHEKAKSHAQGAFHQLKRWPEGDSVLNLGNRKNEHVRTTRILKRGSWQSPGEAVSGGVPEFLHDLPDEDLPTNRLTLARWLADRNSPTTARVVVNRMWLAYFGIGLVTTTDDFGVRSEPPVHPKLLDWLAVELMEPSVKTFAEKPPEPWSLKHLHRLIVNSDTYRQSALADKAIVENDPENKLLARGPRSRADAEMIRDIALSASGLLEPKVGGKSVFPPVPEGLFALSYTAVDFWDTAKDSDRYRRSLYVFRRRSIPDPVLASFDAPSGDFSCVRRTQSNTPLAALTSLNATIFTEAAQSLALRILGEGGQTDREKAQYGYRLCVSRLPNKAETDALLKLLSATRNRLKKGELNAADIAFNEFTRPGDLPPDAPPNEAAAWTIIARVLLNLDATLTKG